VTDAQVGSIECVYGTVVKIQSTSTYVQIIRFSNEAGTFLVRGRIYYFQDLHRGDCVRVDGLVQRDGGYLLIETDQDTTHLRLLTEESCAR
jgi:hypothetical protein